MKEEVFDMLMFLREQLSIMETNEDETEDYKRGVSDARSLIYDSIKNYL